MLSHEQYEKIISTFFVELNHIVSNVSETDLEGLPCFKKDMDEYISELQDRSNKSHEILRTAFSFVDEYASGANKEEVLAAGYEGYKVLCERGED